MKTARVHRQASKMMLRQTRSKEYEIVVATLYISVAVHQNISNLRSEQQPDLQDIISYSLYRLRQ